MHGKEIKLYLMIPVRKDCVVGEFVDRVSENKIPLLKLLALFLVHIFIHNLHKLHTKSINRYITIRHHNL